MTDEITAIRPGDDGYVVSSVPWRGRPTSAPLAGLLRLTQAPETAVTRLSPLQAVRQLLPKAYFATLYAKPAGRPIVDTFVKEFKQTKWIHFPWDIEYKFATPIKDGGRVAPGPG